MEKLLILTSDKTSFVISAIIQTENGFIEAKVESFQRPITQDALEEINALKTKFFNIIETQKQKGFSCITDAESLLFKDRCFAYDLSDQKVLISAFETVSRLIDNFELIVKSPYKVKDIIGFDYDDNGRKVINYRGVVGYGTNDQLLSALDKVPILFGAAYLNPPKDSNWMNSYSNYVLNRENSSAGIDNEVGSSSHYSRLRKMGFIKVDQNG